MTTRTGGRGRAALIALLLLATLLAACGNSESDREQESATSASTSCPGASIKVTIVESLTGGLSFPSVSRDLKDSVRAAVNAINGSCVAGRPIDVKICDDKSDPNQATRCGTEAKGNGSLALFGSVGRTDNAANAAGLPVLLTRNATTFELTNADAYPATSLLTLGIGGISAAAGAGKSEWMLVAYDAPAVQAQEGLVKSIGEGFGVKVDFLLIPPDTTDFAPIAAQIRERDPESIGLGVPAIVPFMNALDAEGITAENLFVSAGVDVFPPDVIEQLGNVANGVYLSSDVVPPTDSDNPGIRQMLKEFRSSGITTSPAELGPMAVIMWSRVHVLAEAISRLEPDVQRSLDGPGLAKALVALGRVERPELAAFDLSKPAFPDIPALAALRVFSDQGMAIQIQDGTYKAVTAFGDVRKPFKIKVSG